MVKNIITIKSKKNKLVPDIVTSGENSSNTKLVTGNPEKPPKLSSLFATSLNISPATIVTIAK